MVILVILVIGNCNIFPVLAQHYAFIREYCLHNFGEIAEEWFIYNSSGRPFKIFKIFFKPAAEVYFLPRS